MISYLQWLNWRIALGLVVVFGLFSIALIAPSFGPDHGSDLDWISGFGVAPGFFAGFMFAGNGIRALWLPRQQSALYYVLSLPVSRRVIVLAHAAAAAAIAVAANAASLGLALVILRLKNVELALDTLGTSVLLSQANSVAVVLGLVAVATLLPAFWFVVAGLALFIGYSGAALTLASDIAEQGMPWQGMSFAIAIAASSLFLTLHFAPKKEY